MSPRGPPARSMPAKLRRAYETLSHSRAGSPLSACAHLCQSHTPLSRRNEVASWRPMPTNVYHPCEIIPSHRGRCGRSPQVLPAMLLNGYGRHQVIGSKPPCLLIFAAKAAHLQESIVRLCNHSLVIEENDSHRINLQCLPKTILGSHAMPARLTPP